MVSCSTYKFRLEPRQTFQIASKRRISHAQKKFCLSAVILGAIGLSAALAQAGGPHIGIGIGISLPAYNPYPYYYGYPYGYYPYDYPYGYP